MPIQQGLKVTGVDKFLAKLRTIRKDVTDQVSQNIIVGYSAAYALYIHENREIWPPGMRLAGQPRDRKLVNKGGAIRNKSGQFAKAGNRGLFWDPQGKAQPKFLEEPARLLTSNGEFGRIIAETTIQTGNVHDGMMLAALRLQAESMQLVPIDQGHLRASAFVGEAPKSNAS